jgi:purine nucleosidase
MHKIIFDCDNTMGVEGRDVDDGLALLYLLGREDVELLGVTTTFGNSTIDIVYENTRKMFDDLNIHNIPLYKGAANPNNRLSPAAEFLASIAQKHKGEITLLATGSLTNLYGAYLIDKNFFKNLKRIVLMGGITKPLIINGKNLDELNFSCDPEATYKVLSSGCDVTVLTGHICLQAFFGEKEFEKLFKNESNRIYKYISDKAYNWYKFIMKEFCINGFYNWDIVAAVYITNPELFDRNIMYICSKPKDFKKGLLKVCDSCVDSYKINIPQEILNVEKFNNIIFKSWENIK